MATTKREFILATCFLSGIAAIISLVALGTQEWVISDVTYNSTRSDAAYVTFGLFTGKFQQKYSITATFDLTMYCAFDHNICALLCGNNPMDYLEKLYNGEIFNVTSCGVTTIKKVLHDRAATDTEKERIFINTGMWISTIIFLCLSAVVGLASAGLSLWNTVSNPYQVYFSIFGLYIYNGIALFCILLSIILWGAEFSQDITRNIPTYKTFIEDFTTDGLAQLGYSYWINLISVFLYIASICLLYVRYYLISKEPKVNVHLEDNADPVIYLY